MAQRIHDDLIVFSDDTKNQVFTVTITDLLRCIRIADERHLVPPHDQAGKGERDASGICDPEIGSEQ